MAVDPGIARGIVASKPTCRPSRWPGRSASSFHAFMRLAARLVGRESPWERVAMRVPASAFGPGLAAAVRRGTSRARARVRVGIHRRHRGVAADLRIRRPTSSCFASGTSGSIPAIFEKLKRGDCEDFALWAWRKLAEIGIDAEFCVGRVICDDRPEIDRQHAWVVYRVNGTAFLFELGRANPVENDSPARGRDGRVRAASSSKARAPLRTRDVATAARPSGRCCANTSSAKPCTRSAFRPRAASRL